jgi:hypothetical protein
MTFTQTLALNKILGFLGFSFLKRKYMLVQFETGVNFRVTAGRAGGRAEYTVRFSCT